MTMPSKAPSLSGVLPIAFLLLGCTPGAVRYNVLSPEPAPSVITGDQLRHYVPGADTLDIDWQSLSHLVMLAADSAIAALSLYEFEDLIYLNLWIYNGRHTAQPLTPSSLSLVDGNRTQFRRLDPHEAANLFLADVRGVPPYQPKYNYYVNTYTYGNYSTSTVYSQEDGFASLGYAIGASIRRSKNRKLTEMASTIYAIGLVDGTEVEPDAVLEGGVYWLNRSGKTYPLRVRIIGTEFEALFWPRR